MAKYVVFFTYSSETWARMIQSPGDRTAAVRQLADSVGGSVECLYWMFGTYDGLGIIEAPDSISAAALSITIGSTGAFKNVETHELLNQEQLSQVLSRSKDATQAYQPPVSKGSAAGASLIRPAVFRENCRADPQESTTDRLSGPDDVLGHPGAQDRPHGSTAVVSSASVDLFVPTSGGANASEGSVTRKQHLIRNSH